MTVIGRATPAVPPARSLLFVPGSRGDLVPKAVASGADAVILDLEDSVPVEAKARARAQIADYLTGEPDPPVPVLVRINALDGPDALADLRAVVRRGLAGIVVPKAERATDVATVDRVLGWLEAEASSEVPMEPVLVLPTIETALGIRSAFDLASASDRTAYMGGIATRGGDVERSVGFRWSPHGAESLTLRGSVLLDIRAAGRPCPVSGMWADVKDLDGLRSFARENRRLGYEGQLCIHPSHVAVINEEFTPTEAELDRDEALVAAMETAAAEGAGAVVFDGTMVDEAMAATSRQRLLRSGRRQS